MGNELLDDAEEAMDLLKEWLGGINPDDDKVVEAHLILKRAVEKAKGE